MKKIVFIFLSLLLIAGCTKKTTEEKQSTENQKTESQKYEIPYSLDDGKIMIQNLFDSSIDNPDHDNEEGESIASLEIVNQSDSTLESAMIDLTMSDGTVYHFVIYDLETWETLWCFDIENQSYSSSNSIQSIEYTTKYTDEDLLKSDSIGTSVEGTTVTLTNLTNGDMNNITVTCHAKLESTIYGGTVYEYTVGQLPANQSISFEAVDCCFGECEVVEIDY